MIVPEVRLKKYLEGIIDIIRRNSNSHSDAESFLYEIFQDKDYGAVMDGKYDFFVQAKDVFVNKGSGNADALEVGIMFNPDKANAPHIHITVPTEDNVDRSIGESPVEDGRGYIYSNNFKSVWDCIITGRSSYEVITIYRVLQSMVVSTLDTLSFMGFYNPVVSGGELHIASEAVPQGIVARSLRITASFSSEIRSTAVFGAELNKLILQGFIITDDDGDTVEQPPIIIER